MKMLFAVSTAVLLAMSSGAFATTKCWVNCDGAASAGASAGGFAGTFMAGSKKNTFSNQSGITEAKADTNPERASAEASLHQETGGLAKGPAVEGELYMEGSTEVDAKVGRYGVSADSMTAGAGYGFAEGTGHVRSELSLYGESKQSSRASDSKWGGEDCAEAQQTTVGRVSSASTGRNEASTNVAVAVTSVAETN